MKKLILASLVALLIIISAGVSKNLLASVVFPTSCTNLQNIIANQGSISPALQQFFNNTKMYCSALGYSYYNFGKELSYGAVVNLLQTISVSPSECYVGSAEWSNGATCTLSSS